MSLYVAWLQEELKKCAFPQRNCSHPAYFTQYPRLLTFTKEKIFFLISRLEIEEILFFSKGPPPPILFKFKGSSKEQVQTRPSLPGTHKEQRWILQSATCWSVLWRTRSTFSVIQEQMSICDEYFPPRNTSQALYLPLPALFVNETPLICQSFFLGKRPQRTLAPPLIAEEDVVEVIVDVQQLLCDLLIGHSGDELHYAVLHGPAGPVQLLGNTCTSGRACWECFPHTLLPLKGFVLSLESHGRRTCLFIKPDVCRMRTAPSSPPQRKRTSADGTSVHIRALHTHTEIHALLCAHKHVIV